MRIRSPGELEVPLLLYFLVFNHGGGLGGRCAVKILLLDHGQHVACAHGVPHRDGYTAYSPGLGRL